MIDDGSWRVVKVMCDVDGKEQCSWEAGGRGALTREDRPGEGQCTPRSGRREDVVAAMETEMHAMFKMTCEPMMAG
jgi:hypothetical protein